KLSKILSDEAKIVKYVFPPPVPPPVLDQPPQPLYTPLHSRRLSFQLWEEIHCEVNELGSFGGRIVRSDSLSARDFRIANNSDHLRRRDRSDERRSDRREGDRH